MNNRFYIFYFISLIYLFNCLPSDNIWSKVVQYNISKLMVFNNSNYFIFQEKDYCKKDIHSKEMEDLYEKQKSFFTKWETANYIFVVDYFDENQEPIQDGAFHLSQYLYNNLGVKMEKSVLALFSIETRRVTIRTGEITKKDLLDKEAEDVISSLKELLQQNNYYEAFLKYYELIDYYMDHNKLSVGIIIYFIVLGIIVIAIFIGIFIVYIERCFYLCKKPFQLPNDDKLKDIVEFLKSKKGNKKIFTEECIICLNSLTIHKKNKENIDEEILKINLISKEENGISTLNCGHQFHTNCIIKWYNMKNSCPICRQIILKENDSNKIVWKTQIDLHPRFNNINYNHLYTRNFYSPPPPISHSNYSSNYSSNYAFGGGANCGGGATGGW